MNLKEEVSIDFGNWQSERVTFSFVWFPHFILLRLVFFIKMEGLCLSFVILFFQYLQVVFAYNMILAIYWVSYIGFLWYKFLGNKIADIFALCHRSLETLHYQVKHKQKYEMEVALKPLWDKRWIHIPNRNNVSHKIMPVTPTAFAAGATLVGWLIYLLR